MATIDTSLFPSATFKVDTGEAMPVTSRLNALRQSQLGDIQLQQAQQALEEENALRQAVKGLDLSTPEGQQAYGQALLNRGNVKAYQEFQAGLAAQTKAGHEAQTAKLQYDKAHHDEVNTLIGDVTRYTSADQAKSALDSLLEQGKIDTQTHGLYSGMIASTPWPQAKTQILGGLRSVQEQFESMQPTTQLGKLQNDLVAARARGDKEAEAQISDAIYKETHFAPQAKTTSIVNLPPAQTAEQKAHGEQLVSTYGDIKSAATTARNQRTTVDIMDKLLTEGFETGFGKEATAKAANVLTSLGVKDAAKYAADAQSFQAAVRQNVLDEQMKQKGVQTEGDAQRIEETSARLGNTTEANKFLVAVRRAQQDRAMTQQKFWDNWWTKNKTYEGAEQAWNEGEGGKSIFDTPALKKYAAPADGAYQDKDKEARYQAWKAQQSKR